ncbi:phage protein [Methylophaga sp. OBS4]|uniref:phage protein n=1 Tax=Methylophaga sp. OBS4 TaxID=2991935 RepID=UPI00224FB406|nr:phage protein [Methylophaga sp. OBS4]MCX4187170.1 DUF2597 family protein [Methylophaga sp. OBS4]
MKNLSGQNFDIMAGDTLIHVEAMTASITDNSKAVMSRGVPNGWVDGDAACSGEMELDSRNFNLLVDAAKAAGSWRGLEPFDIVTTGKALDQEQKVELFGCKVKVSDLLDIDPNGGEKTKHKVPFEVTSPDFVRINGVPYLSEDDTRDL